MIRRPLSYPLNNPLIKKWTILTLLKQIINANLLNILTSHYYFWMFIPRCKISPCEKIIDLKISLVTVSNLLKNLVVKF